LKVEAKGVEHMNETTSYDRKRFHFNNDFFSEPRQYEYVSLYQIGDLSCDSGFTMMRHTQVCYEISYIISGKGWYSTDSKKYNLEAGDIYVGLPGQVHEGKADTLDPFRYFYMGFMFNNSDSDGNSFTHIERMLKNLSCPVIKDKFDIQTHFLNVLKEMKNVTQYSHMMVQTYIAQIIIIMYRNFFSEWDFSYRIVKEKESTKDVVYNAINYIDRNLMNIKELGQIAQELRYSYSYLSHIFSEETGLTLRDYYAQKRLVKTIELLKSGEYNITQIAEMLNYQSIYSFSKAFKKSVGISPTEYIRLNSGR
jgi:AraC-like DNA-binding protein